MEKCRARNKDRKTNPVRSEEGKKNPPTSPLPLLHSSTKAPVLHPSFIRRPSERRGEEQRSGPTLSSEKLETSERFEL